MPHANKRFVLYGGFCHELLNEVERERVFEEVDRWIGVHLSSPSSRAR